MARPVVCAEISRAETDLLRMDARIVGQPFPRVTDLLNAAFALCVGRACAANLKHLVEQVVVVENRDLSHLTQTIRAKTHDPRVRPEHVPCHAVPGPNLA